ncbi:MAG: hypothetical protein ACTTKH_03020, partial [Treponema sp.]
KSLEKEPFRIDAKINYELSIKQLDDELIQKARKAKMSKKEDDDTYNAIIDIFRKQEKEEWNEKKESTKQESGYDY